MKLFTAYERTGRWRFVPDRSFSFGALLFGPVWLLFRGAIGAAFAAGALEFALLALSRRPSDAVWAGLLLRATVLAIGMFGDALCALELRAGGFRPQGPVVAADRDGALLRVLERGA